MLQAMPCGCSQTGVLEVTVWSNIITKPTVLFPESNLGYKREEESGIGVKKAPHSTF
jgi:hypothetical protein